jgi:hypothetical protein
MAKKDWRLLAQKNMPMTTALRQWMLPCKEVTGATGYQDENLLLPLMQPALSSSPRNLHFQPGVALLQAMRAGIEEELPVLNFRLWSLQEECIGLLMALHKDFLTMFLEAGFSWQKEHLVDPTLSNVPDDILGLIHNEYESLVVLYEAAQVFRDFL